MNRLNVQPGIKLLGLALIALVLLIPTAIMFAKEIGAMEIAGSGIDGTMRLDNPDVLNQLSISGFFDSSSDLRMSEEQIAALGEGYEITIYFSDDTGEMVHRELLWYYPDPEGGRGYHHWVGGGSVGSDIMPDSRWRRVHSGEDVFWQVMEAQGISQSETASLPTEVAERASVNWTWIGAAGIVAMILVAANVWLIRQRQARQSLEKAAALD